MALYFGEDYLDFFFFLNIVIKDVLRGVQELCLLPNSDNTASTFIPLINGISIAVEMSVVIDGNKFKVTKMWC